MGVLEQLARAEVSSDLTHRERFCDVDVLGAAGMAGINIRHICAFRLKFLNDTTELDSAKRLFAEWARSAMRRRGVDTSGASRMGVQALTYWLDPLCTGCGGLKFEAIEGAPTLSDRPCKCCGGSGRKPIKRHGAEGEVFRDLLDRADAAVATVHFAISAKLGER